MDPCFPADPREAAALQKALAARVRETDRPRRLSRVAGVDVSYDSESRTAFAVLIVVSYPEGEPIMEASAEGPVTFPYIPGLLSFREAPLCLELLKPLRGEFDCLVVDGQGIAHPRRLGLASHLGLLLNKPTVGCAKSRLWGEQRRALASRRGAVASLYDGDAIIGAVLRTRAGVKPVYVSVGHRARLDWARELVLTLAPRYRIPQPTRLAHLAVTKVRTQRRDAAEAAGRGH